MKHHRTSPSMIAVTLFFAVAAATAQTYTPLYTYPGTNQNNAAWSSVVGAGRRFVHH
jgi:hypothetical protein